jgi:hypothetical protein
MGTPLRLTRSQTEKALCAFIKAKLPDAPSPAPITAPVFIRQGQVNDEGSLILENPDDIPLPSIVVAVPSVRRHEMGYGVCEVHVVVCGGVDGTNAASKHDALAGYIMAILGEDNRGTVLTALNPPASGSDERDVKEFRAFGYLLANEFSQETGRAWMDDLVFEFHCQPTDDISG